MLSARSEAQFYSEINMTPLIDVLLVLLIILIMTIPSQTHAVKIDNPSSAGLPTVRPTVIELSISSLSTRSWRKPWRICSIVVCKRSAS